MEKFPSLLLASQNRGKCAGHPRGILSENGELRNFKRLWEWEPYADEYEVHLGWAILNIYEYFRDHFASFRRENMMERYQ